MKSTLAREEIKYYQGVVQNQVVAVDSEISFLKIQKDSGCAEVVKMLDDLKGRCKAVVAGWEKLTETMAELTQGDGDAQPENFCGGWRLILTPTSYFPPNPASRDLFTGFSMVSGCGFTRLMLNNLVKFREV